MASCVQFAVDRKQLLEDIKSLNDDAESRRRICFIAARKIQAWFRGIATRNHIRTLNAMATVIQRHWRGYRARRFRERFLINRVKLMWQNHYNLMASRIQAAWRRYRTRKNGFDVGRSVNWISSVYEKNKLTQERMRSFRENEIQRQKSEIEKESLLWILYILFKLHHLLRTKQRPGIVTSIDRNRLTSVEKMIKCLEYSVYIENKRLKNICFKDLKSIHVQPLLHGTRFEKCERAIRAFEKSATAGDRFSREQKTLRAQVERFAREMCGANYHETISHQLESPLSSYKQSCN